jgi:hypothetical protein
MPLCLHFIWMSASLSVHLFECLLLCLFTRLYIYFSVLPSVCLSTSQPLACLSAYLLFHLFVNIHHCLSIFLCPSASISVSLSVHLSKSPILSICQYIFLSISLSICLSICLLMCLCLLMRWILIE